MKAPVENADVMDEAPFRVSVNLERFFNDERARCYVSVLSRRRVRWLQRRLRRLFVLPRRVSLLLRDHLLPPDETLALLRPDDTVHVIPSEIDWIDTKKCVTQTIDTSISDEDGTAQLSKRKKYVHPLKNKMDISNNDTVDCTSSCDVIPLKATDSSDNTVDNTAALQSHDIIPFKVTDNSEMNIEDSAPVQSEEILNQSINQEMLMEVKNRALALLEDYETERSANTSQELPARRTRRRVRRRRARPPPAPPALPAPAAPAPAPPAPVPATQDETDSILMTKQVWDSVELELQPPSQFLFCGVDTSVPIVVRNNSVTPREARIVHPIQ